ncbi:alpha-amylase family protein [Spirosoma validum]|uniref:Alpha amylase n=1 Tax=Spirosoma validum TaxID=2771355 RepID=A0A927B6J6_9BACT|nr:alpha-amylase family glycosyl hydrolase [Spirosoma validum]MBD2756136.1 alpha amylase [Spirosoma validum]
MRLVRKTITLIAILAGLTAPAFAQQVLMQGFYYDIPKAQCGASWADTLAAKAAQLATSGFTHIWTPPFQGNGPNSGGYDPKDLYIGTNSTVTSLGTKQQILDMVATFNGTGMQVVGDMIYNHRDGGLPENNDPVLDYIMNHAGNTSSQSCYQYSMPSDRYRMILPVGGSTGNGTGNYYVNISSRTGTYAGSKYMLYVTTNKIGGSRWAPVNPTTVVVPEQGPAYGVQLGTNYEVTIDNNGDSDEFQVSLNAADFNATDTLFVQMININPGDVTSYSNHRIWKIWYDPLGSPGNGSGRDLADYANMFAGGGGFNPNYRIRAQTFTNFCNLPGGGPCMNGSNFRPNWSGDPASDVSATCLGPAYSQQSMDYFYDYDHQNPDTKQKLIDWTLWSWDQVGIRGLRMDAIKHFPASFVGDLLCAMHAAGKDPSLIVGEWYGQDPGPQGSWLSQVYAKLNACGAGALSPKVFDFNLRDQLKKASDGGNGASTSADCNDASVWDVRTIFDGSLHDGSSFSGNNVVTMLNNHDFRSSDPTYGDALIHDRADALNSYAYMLTNNQLGVPTVFWPDYYGYPASVSTWNGTACVPQAFSYFPTWSQGGLKTEIDQLISVLKNYIQGSTGIDYLNKFGGPAITYYSGCYKRSLIYQNNANGSIGGKEVLNVINYGDQPVDAEIPIILRNGLAAGQLFTKVAGTTSTSAVIVSGSGTLRVTVPAHSFATWVQEIAPVAGSGSIKINNSGGTKPVTVPATTFTNIAPSSDASPGMVKAIRIISFPTNTTSLTINTTIYTASSAAFSGVTPAGITLQTDGNGNPTATILLDPTIDINPVIISFVAVDNVGNESTNTGTAVLIPAPDLVPTLYARPSSQYGTSACSVVVDVVELNSINAGGPVIVRVTKDAKVQLSFTSGATLIGGRLVQNSGWTFDNLSNTNYYILTSTEAVPAGDKLSFGLDGLLTPGATVGALTISAVIVGSNGEEVNAGNNIDADKIEYFQQ